MKSLRLLHGEVSLPNFFPDGTYGAVKTLDGDDLYECRVDGIVMNAFHLYMKPGLSIIKKHGGIHRFMQFDRPVLTDSGGFQVFSLLRENKKNGSINEKEIIFRPKQDEKKVIFTPEKSIQLQFAVRADVIMCLDYCTHPDESAQVQARSVDITVKWAGRCKAEYEKQLKNYKYGDGRRPLLFGIIQGGQDMALRQRCAEALTALGFDGFGFGGFPVDEQGRLTEEILRYTAELMPDHLTKYAMGLGRPEEIVRCADMGYDLFDCVIPTREARHQRLYVFNGGDLRGSARFYDYLYILDEKYAADTSPVSETCGCRCCTKYSKAYLRHLFKMGDPLALRLATIHNLRFYTELLARLREERA